MSKRRVYDYKAGDVGTVYLNGDSVPFATSCETGRDGWVKRYKTDAAGEIALENDATVEICECGNVRFVRREAP